MVSTGSRALDFALGVGEFAPKMPQLPEVMLPKVEPVQTHQGFNTPFDPLIDQAASRYGVPPNLLRAVISAESSGNPNAVSNKGAGGLMQLMPGTAARYGVKDVHDPYQNVMGGAHYLSDLLHQFNNNVPLALAGYNAGEGAVIKHGYKIPNYAETQAYVPKVLNIYNQLNQQGSPEPGTGTPPEQTGRFVDSVNPALKQILTIAAQESPFRVQFTSGFRENDPLQHGKHNAIDVQLINPTTGQVLPNSKSPQTAYLYQQFANKAREVQQRLYPELSNKFRWGGYFGGPKSKYGALDLMHFDLGGDTAGMLGGSWDRGFNEQQMATWRLPSPGTGVSVPTQEPATATPQGPRLVAAPPGQRPVWLSNGTQLNVPEKMDDSQVAKLLENHENEAYRGAVPTKPMTVKGKSLMVPFSFSPQDVEHILVKQGAIEGPGLLGSLWQHGVSEAERMVGRTAQYFGDKDTAQRAKRLANEGDWTTSDVEVDMAKRENPLLGFGALARQNLAEPLAGIAGSVGPSLGLGALASPFVGPVAAGVAAAATQYPSSVEEIKEYGEATGHPVSNFAAGVAGVPYAALMTTGLPLRGAARVLGLKGAEQAITGLVEHGAVEEAQRLVGSGLWNRAKDAAKAYVGNVAANTALFEALDSVKRVASGQGPVDPNFEEHVNILKQAAWFAAPHAIEAGALGQARRQSALDQALAHVEARRNPQAAPANRAPITEGFEQATGMSGLRPEADEGSTVEPGPDQPSAPGITVGPPVPPHVAEALQAAQDWAQFRAENPDSPKTMAEFYAELNPRDEPSDVHEDVVDHPVPSRATPEASFEHPLTKELDDSVEAYYVKATNALNNPTTTNIEAANKAYNAVKSTAKRLEIDEAIPDEVHGHSDVLKELSKLSNEFNAASAKFKTDQLDESHAALEQKQKALSAFYEQLKLPLPKKYAKIPDKPVSSAVAEELKPTVTEEPFTEETIIPTNEVKQNAEQIPEASTPNGDGGARSKDGQEGRRADESGEGIQSSGQEDRNIKKGQTSTPLDFNALTDAEKEKLAKRISKLQFNGADNGTIAKSIGVTRNEVPAILRSLGLENTDVKFEESGSKPKDKKPTVGKKPKIEPPKSTSAKVKEKPQVKSSESSVDEAKLQALIDKIDSFSTKKVAESSPPPKEGALPQVQRVAPRRKPGQIELSEPKGNMVRARTTVGPEQIESVIDLAYDDATKTWSLKTANDETVAENLSKEKALELSKDILQSSRVKEDKGITYALIDNKPIILSKVTDHKSESKALTKYFDDWKDNVGNEVKEISSIAQAASKEKLPGVRRILQQVADVYNHHAENPHALEDLQRLKFQLKDELGIIEGQYTRIWGELTHDEQHAVAKELGQGDAEVGYKKAVEIAKDSILAPSAFRQALTKLSTVVKNVIEKIARTLQAIMVAFHFDVAVPFKEIKVPDVALTVERQIKKPSVDARGIDIPFAVRAVANHELRTHKGNAFMVLDKKGGFIYAFDTQGKIIGVSPALSGKTVGDIRPKEAIGLAPEFHQEKDKVTPAGRYETTYRLVKEYGTALVLDELKNLAIHRTYLGTPSEKRPERLASVSPADNRISFGCINVPAEFYDKVLEPYFTPRSSISILPDTQSLKETFGNIDFHDTYTERSKVYMPSSSAWSLNPDKHEGFADRVKYYSTKQTEHPEAVNVGEKLKSEGTVAENPHTAESLKQALSDQYGDRKPIVEIKSREEAGVDEGTWAYYDTKSKHVVLVHDNIDAKEDLHGLLKHEIGVHAQKMGMKDSEFQGILHHLEGMKGRGIRAVDEAYQRVPNKTSAHLINEEALGYLVQHHPQLPIARRFMSWLRRLAHKLTGNAGWLKPEDLSEIANRVLKRDYGLESRPNRDIYNKLESYVEGTKVYKIPQEQINGYINRFKNDTLDAYHAAIGYANPREFLRAVTSLSEEKSIFNDLKNHGNPELNQVGPILVIVDSDGRIIDHEGRHRAAYLAEKGVEKLPIIIQRYSPSANKLPSIVAPQKSGGNTGREALALLGLTPLVPENRVKIAEKYLAKDTRLFAKRQDPIIDEIDQAGLTTREEPMGFKETHDEAIKFAKEIKSSFRTEFVDFLEPLAKKVKDLPVMYGPKHHEKLRSDMVGYEAENAAGFVGSAIQLGTPTINESRAMMIKRTKANLKDITKYLFKHHKDGDKLFGYQLKVLALKDLWGTARQDAADITRLRGEIASYKNQVDMLRHLGRTDASLRPHEETARRELEKKKEALALKLRFTKIDPETLKPNLPELTPERLALFDKIEREHPWLQQALTDTRSMIHGIVDFMESGGMIDRAKAQNWKSWNYAPLYKALEYLEEEPQHGAGQRFGSTPETLRMIKELKGNLFKSNMLENLHKLHYVAMIPTIINNSRHAAIEDMLTLEALYKQRENSGLSFEDAMREATREMEVRNRSTNTVKAMIKGEERHFKIDDADLLETLAFSRATHGGWVTVLGSFASLQRTAHLKQLAFWTKQIALEPIYANFMTGLKTLIHPGQAIVNLWKIAAGKNLNAKTLENHGLDTGWHDSAGERSFSFSRMDAPTPYHALVGRQSFIGKAVKVLDDIHNSVDESIRTAVYEAALKDGRELGLEGQSLEDWAVTKARNYINFANRGRNQLANEIRAVTAFSSAAINSLNSIYKNASGHNLNAKEAAMVRKIFWTRVAATVPMVVGYEVMLQALGAKNEQDDVTKYTNIPIGKSIQIPFAWDIGTFIVGIPRVLTDMMLLRAADENHLTVEQGFKRITKLLWDNVVPPVMPTALKAAVEPAVNFDFRAWAPIEGAGAQRRLPEYRGKASSEIGSAIGEALGMSPKRWDHFNKALFGWTYDLANKAVEVLEGDYTPRPMEPSKRDKYYGYGQFERAEMPGVDIIFDAQAKAEQAKNSLNDARKEGNREVVAKLQADKKLKVYRDHASMFKHMTTVLNNFEVRISAISNRKGLTAQAKEALMREEYNRKKEYARQARQRVLKILGEFAP